MKKAELKKMWPKTVDEDPRRRLRYHIEEKLLDR